MNKITLESLIQEHKERLPYLRGVGDMLSYYEYPDMEAYHKWLAKTIRYIEIQSPNDKHVVEFCEVSKEDIYPDQQQKLLAILEVFAVLPIDKMADDIKNKSKTLLANNCRSFEQKDFVGFKTIFDRIEKNRQL